MFCRKSGEGEFVDEEPEPFRFLEAVVFVTRAREPPTFGDSPDVPTVPAPEVDDKRRNGEGRGLAPLTDRARRRGTDAVTVTVTIQALEDNHRCVWCSTRLTAGTAKGGGVAPHRLLWRQS